MNTSKLKGYLHISSMPIVPVEVSCVKKQYDKTNCTDYDKAALAVQEKLRLNLKPAHHSCTVSLTFQTSSY